MRNIQGARIVATVALFGAMTVNAAVAAAEADRLGRDLTPVGAERAGNAAGTIPAWTGGLAAKPIDPAAGYVDPFARDPILFTITAQNLDRHRDKLSVGHVALLERHPETYRMHVYATRRNAAWPTQVLSEVKQQAPLARTEGYRLLDVGKSAVHRSRNRRRSRAVGCGRES